ncbi:hypothetical protein G6F57_014562 [Rhizopus arrhizus]|nr:hypothetical protein G6F57_014562 [Rhizopus arrhizus]
MLHGTAWAGHHAHAAIQGQVNTFFTGIVNFYDPAKNTVAFLGEEFHGPVAFALHGMMLPPFWLTLAGFLLAALFYLWKPDLSGKARKTFAPLVSVLENKYGFDKLWIDGFAGGSVKLGKVSRWIDSNIVDGVVNLSARVVDVAAGVLRRTQSGFLYHYAFAMIIGLIALVLIWLPILGGALILAIRDAQTARWASLGVAVLTFVASLSLLSGYNAGIDGLQFVETHAWIPAYKIGYNLGVDGIAVALILLTTLVSVLALIGAWSAIDKRVNQYVAAFLILEGVTVGDADPDVPDHRCLGWPAPHLRRAEVLPVHLPWLGADAGGADLPVPEGRQLPAGRPVRAAAVGQGTDLDLLRLPDRLRGQGADVPGPHLAAGCPRGSADRRFGDPGRHRPEDRWLRLPALQPADRPGRIAGMGLAGDRAVADRGDLRRPGRPGAGRHEEADRVFVDRAHGLRHPRYLHRPVAGA